MTEPTTDRITAITVRGLRCLYDVRLDLSPVSVLIGDNGSGKSSLVEACELLRRITESEFLKPFHDLHGGLTSLLSQDATELLLSIEADGPEGALSYRLALSSRGGELFVREERLLAGASDPQQHEWEEVLNRDAQAIVVASEGGRRIEPAFNVPPGRPFLGAVGLHPPHSAIGRLINLLSRIEVHLPFQTMPNWVSRDHLGRFSPTREPNVLQRTQVLSRLGGNLANAYHGLRNASTEAQWQLTLDWIRLGLGHQIEGVRSPADPSGGRVGLALKYRNLPEPVPAYSLSDGTLAFLAMVAAIRLAHENPPSLFVFDEPETHLHPGLQLRVLSFLEALSETVPVVLTTHSDRLLDGLSEPAASAVLCELDQSGHAALSRPDPKELARWLQDYRGLGEIRGAGFMGAVLEESRE